MGSPFAPQKKRFNIDEEGRRDSKALCVCLPKSVGEPRAKMCCVCHLASRQSHITLLNDKDITLYLHGYVVYIFKCNDCRALQLTFTMQK